MRKKTKISASLISFLTIGVVVVIYLSFIFYQSSNEDKKPKTKVSSIDMLSIDSLKRVSVTDTVEYFTLEINRIKKESMTKDTLNTQRISELIKLKKNYDSIENKLDYYRQKLKDTKFPNDTIVH